MPKSCDLIKGLVLFDKALEDNSHRRELAHMCYVCFGIYSPIICIITLRSLGPASISNNTICCHVPNIM